MPDGFFSDQKDPIWVYFGGPWNEMENVVIINSHY
jgi:hypothetical protein